MLSRFSVLFRPSCERLSPSLASSITSRPLLRNTFATRTTEPLSVPLTAPNGLKYNQPTGLFINNTWEPSIANTKITSINPTDETEITSVHAAEVRDVDHAISSARNAFKGTWRDLPPGERGNMLYKLSQVVEEHREVLATIEAWDNGKPYKIARDEDIAEAVGTLRYYAGWADKIHGQVIDSSAVKLAYTIKEPVGVCGQIIPWNYPLGMAAWKLGPALACGNTVVLKPAEETPLSILYFANLIREAGFPPGVVNIVNGRGEIAGARLAQHPGVDKIAFTGSTATGRKIMKEASGTLKNITLETGGKSPLLVFDDADLEQAVKWSHAGVMSNMGQVCSATSRILVQETIYERFIEAFTKHIKQASVIGDPFAESTSQGPQVTKAQHARILSYIEQGKSEGATLVTGGGEDSNERSPDVHSKGKGKGFFISPAVFRDVKDWMRISREEVFGPVVTIASFVEEGEAVERANDSVYGLGAAVFTRDIARAHRVAGRMEAGMVWVNSSNDGDWRVPFGGVKQSGVGRELGEAGLRGYLSEKAVHVNLGTVL